MGKVRFASVAATAEAQNHHRYSEHGSWKLRAPLEAQGTSEPPGPLHSGAFLYGPCMSPRPICHSCISASTLAPFPERTHSLCHSPSLFPSSVPCTSQFVECPRNWGQAL